MDVKVLKAPHELISVNLPVSIIVQDAEHAAKTSDLHRSSLGENVLDILKHLSTVVLWGLLDGLGLSGGAGHAQAPGVGRANLLVSLFTDHLSVVLASEDLGLGRYRSVHARHLALVAEIVDVRNSISWEGLHGGAVLKSDAVSGHNGGSLLCLAVTWNDSPDGVVGRLGVKADFLVAGEASKAKRRDLARAEEERLVVDVGVGSNSDLLSIAHDVVPLGDSFRFLVLLDHVDRTSTGVHLASRGHSVSLVMGSDAISHIANEMSVGLQTLNHDWVAEFDSAALSVGDGNLWTFRA
jgi:hypothetical protein